LNKYPPDFGTIARPYETIGGGLSGASVLLIDIRAPQGDPHAYDGKAYAKFDRTRQIHQEYNKHRNAQFGMEHCIPSVIMRPLDDPSGYSLIIYRPAGVAVVGAQSLARVVDDFRQNKYATDAISLAVKRLQDDGLSRWVKIDQLIHDRSVEQPQQFLHDLLNRGDEKRSNDLEDRLAEYFSVPYTVQQLTFIVETTGKNSAITLPNPLYFARSPYFAPKHYELPLLHIARTRMHGDLHSGNIICRLESNRELADAIPQVIDLALFEPEGHIFFDLAYLEFDLLSRAMPITTRQDWCNWLVLFRYLFENGLEPPNKPLGISSAAVYPLVQPIRHFVADVVKQIMQSSETTAEDYTTLWWLAACAAGLSISRSRHTDPLKRSAALVYAAWATENLTAPLQISRGGVPKVLIWDEKYGLTSKGSHDEDGTPSEGIIPDSPFSPPQPESEELPSEIERQIDELIATLRQAKADLNRAEAVTIGKQILTLMGDHAHPQKDSVCKEMVAAARDLGHQCYVEDRFAEAVEYFNAVLDCDPDNSDIQWVRAQCYRKLNDAAHAIVDLTTLLEKKQYALDNRLYRQRAQCYLDIGAYDKAAIDLTSIIRNDGGDADTYHLQGVAYFYLKDYAKAIEDMSKAIELSPENSFYYRERGINLRNNWNYDEAIDDFSQALVFNSTDKLCYEYRASCYFRKGNYSRSIEDLTQAIALDPKNAEYYHLRAVSHNRKREYDESIEDLSQAIGLDGGKNSHYLRERAVNLAAKNLHVQAIEDLSEAIEGSPANNRSQLAEYYKLRAESRQALGQEAEAKADRQLMLMLDPFVIYGDSQTR
jgi:tetratricopeptide (TPR) repeat protein